jgi:RHS repeat-associated protein
MLVERYSYDVFGNTTIRDQGGGLRNNSLYGNPYMFTGREYDPCTGLYYYRARYYKPSIGRFLQTDPQYYRDGLNLYTYVKNNPIMATDPMGKIARCPREEKDIKTNPHFCDDSGWGSALHSPWHCYRETVPEGSQPPWGNQCCYSNAGEFCEQSPDFIAPAVGKKGDGTCKKSLCRLAGHFARDYPFLSGWRDVAVRRSWRSRANCCNPSSRR